MRRLWLIVILPAALVLSPSLVVLFQGEAPTFLLEMLVGKSFLLYLALVLAWLALVQIVPRIEPPSRLDKSLLVAGIFSMATFVLSVGLWFEAVEINVLEENPRVSSLEDLKTQWERPWGEIPNGIFVVGRIKPPEDPEQEADVVAHYAYRSNKSSYFPLFLDVMLSDGEVIEVACIKGPGRAVNWPETSAHTLALKEGDPIVIWGDPSSSVDAGDGNKNYGVLGTQILLHGGEAELDSAVLVPAKKAARPTGWMAFAVMLLSWVPVFVAWRLARSSS